MGAGSGREMLMVILILILVSIALLALIVAYIYTRKKAQEALEFARELGFTPVSKPEEDVMQRLRTVYQQSSWLRVHNAAQKGSGTEKILLFDATTSGANYGQRSRSGNSEFRNVAIISSHLNLPPFLLVRRMPSLGPLGNVLNDLMTKGVSLAGFVEWSNVPPDFSLLYLIYFKENTQPERVFSEQVLSRIAQTKDIIARGQGDTLIFNTYDVHRGAKLDVNELSNHIQRAQQLVSWLSSHS